MEIPEQARNDVECLDELSAQELTSPRPLRTVTDGSAEEGSNSA